MDVGQNGRDYYGSRMEALVRKSIYMEYPCEAVAKLLIAVFLME